MRVTMRRRLPPKVRMYTGDDAKKLSAALALGAVSIALWGIALIALISKKFFGI